MLYSTNLGIFRKTDISRMKGKWNGRSSVRDRGGTPQRSEEFEPKARPDQKEGHAQILRLNISGIYSQKEIICIFMYLFHAISIMT